MGKFPKRPNRGIKSAEQGTKDPSQGKSREAPSLYGLCAEASFSGSALDPEQACRGAAEGRDAVVGAVSRERVVDRPSSDCGFMAEIPFLRVDDRHAGGRCQYRAPAKASRLRLVHRSGHLSSAGKPRHFRSPVRMKAVGGCRSGQQGALYTELHGSTWRLAKQHKDMLPETHRHPSAIVFSLYCNKSQVRLL